MPSLHSDHLRSAEPSEDQSCDAIASHPTKPELWSGQLLQQLESCETDRWAWMQYVGYPAPNTDWFADECPGFSVRIVKNERTDSFIDSYSLLLLVYVLTFSANWCIFLKLTFFTITVKHSISFSLHVLQWLHFLLLLFLFDSLFCHWSKSCKKVYSHCKQTHSPASVWFRLRPTWKNSLQVWIKQGRREHSLNTLHGWKYCETPVFQG